MSQVFLSYSHHDVGDAAVIREILCRHGLNVWWDAESGKMWASELGRALEQSDSMIVLISPHAVLSDLVRRELQYAISNERFENRLFPVIIAPTANMPWCFRFLPVFDVTKGRTGRLRKLAETIKAKTRCAIRPATRSSATAQSHRSSR